MTWIALGPGTPTSPFPATPLLTGQLRLLSLLIHVNLLVTCCLGFTDHCLNEAFNASCPEGRVVLITEARFGRMRSGRCIGGAFNVGCYKDIKTHLDSLCTARSRCDVSVRDLVDLHPCQRDFVSYLEANYVCVRGRAASSTRTHGYSVPK